MTATLRPIILSALFALSLHAQFEPDSAHVVLIFPQLADGGTERQSWQTSITLSNPNPAIPSLCRVEFLGSNGQPLPLDFGQGPASQLDLTLSPQGRRTLRSRGAGPSIVTGWARAACSSPVQGTVLFRALEQGVPKVEISAFGGAPTSRYVSIANRDLGIALANIYTGVTMTLFLRAYDSTGMKTAEGRVVLCPLCHSARTLGEVMPGLPASFEGTVLIESAHPLATFAAWTMNSERGLLSSLPNGGTSWPVDHWSRMWLVFNKLMNAARMIWPSVDLTSVRLEIPSDPVINAYARRDGAVGIYGAVSELMGDSPSELAFVVAHEIAHIVQFRAGRNLIVSNNAELDADAVGMLMALAAGYDPYAGSGALGKLMMATQRAGLMAQLFDDLTDPHTSFSNRMGSMFTVLTAVCSLPEGRQFCAAYKQFLHPSFPPSLPLDPAGGVASHRGN